MITIEKFAEEVKKKIDEKIKSTGGKDETSLVTCYLNNSASLALAIQAENRKVHLNVRMERLYSLYLISVDSGLKEDGMNKIVDQIWDEYLDFCLAKDEHKDAMLDDMFKEILCFDKVKDRVMYKLINQKLNEERLTKIPHRLIEDLAIIYYIDINEDSQNKYSITIDNNIINTWKITEEELFKHAEQNTVKKYPLYVISMDSLVGLPMNTHMYVVSNRFGMDGAIAVFYPDALKSLAEKFNDDLMIIPSSINEVIVVPMKAVKSKNMDVNGIARMIGNINKECVANSEILSDHPYIYYKKADSVIAW